MTPNRRRAAAMLLSATLAAGCTSAAAGRQSGPPRTAPTTAPAPDPSTTVAIPTTTTTTRPRGPSLAGADRTLRLWAASRAGITEVSIGNLDDGVITDVTPQPQTGLRIASVMKVSIAIAYLRQREQEHLAPTSGQLGELTEMIEESDNDDAENLWDQSGGSAALQVTEAMAGLTQTAYEPGHGWGFALTTAHDQAQLEAALARGRMLDPADTALVLGLMRNVEPSQRWGFADTVNPALAPAIKNGWYEDTDAPVWRIHCTAIIDSPALAHRFSIAVMTRYPSSLGMAYGEDTCRGVAQRLGAWLSPRRS